MSDPIAALLDEASAGYRRAGRFAWRFARFKLNRDPAFRGILRLGLLQDRASLLDLGCGQGLLAAWLLAARACQASERAGDWPSAWPAPPRLIFYMGIELNPAEARRARVALEAQGERFKVVEGDIDAIPFPPVDAVVILDVLHYLEHPRQEEVLRRVRAALAPEGLLLLRVGDAAGGSGFRLSKIMDRTVALFRTGHWRPLWCRTLAEWRTLLGNLGFSITSIPMSEGTPFTNTLLVAQCG